MTVGLRLVALVSTVLLPLSGISAADENVAVKCSTNQDRVWVYDSLTTFNVEAKVKCGESVTLIARTDGYVKVRTATGTEGYVPEENVPTAGAAAISAAPEKNATSWPRLANTTSALQIASAQPSVRPALFDSTHGAVPSTIASQSQPESASVSPTIAAEEVPGSVPSGSTNGATSAVPATTLVAPPEFRRANATVAHAFAKPGKGSQPNQPESVRASTDIYAADSATTAATARPAAVGNISDASADDEGDDNSYLIPPKSASDDPACKSYFSGYGLTIEQFNWVIDHRKKSFPAVCPAATPAMVDYVIIFTHDVDFFSYTMPAPVHEERDGFTDWNPIVLCDSNSVPCSKINNSKREYVWVFHVKRGTYDPGRFSPHRRFQFTKIESKYSRTVEDAFRFIETHDGAR
ncbi:MAG: hypothetical protein ACRD8A_08300 [Candidatus Acidiferrales bacterium]